MTTKTLLDENPCQPAIAAICGLDWPGLSEADMFGAAWGYYFFSIQFRENLELALSLFPEDKNLQRLHLEECDTANLSPYPGIAVAGERLNHDEFMRRALHLTPVDPDTHTQYMAAGERYLEEVRRIDPLVRALSMSSYEDGGLSAVFTAMLRAPVFANETLAAFRFFLAEHVRFDSDPDEGHGNLSRHLPPDENVALLWTAFRQLFLDFVPHFATASAEVLVDAV